MPFKTLKKKRAQKIVKKLNFPSFAFPFSLAFTLFWLTVFSVRTGFFSPNPPAGFSSLDPAGAGFPAPSLGRLANGGKAGALVDVAFLLSLLVPHTKHLRDPGLFA